MVGTGSGAPDGSFVIVRDGRRFLELVSDIVGSRTLWYVLTDQAFLASTSQRALVALLGDFALSRVAVAWMLSSGSLGPDGSWDARLRAVPPDSRVTLDREEWSLRVDRCEVRYRPRRIDEREHATRLLRAAVETCSHLRSLGPGWLLSLSGGMDSRALLAFMVRAGLHPRCVTWGMESAQASSRGDAAIATRVAESLGVDHSFVCIDSSSVTAEEVLSRFLVAGDGRVDHLSAYTDGLRLWGRLFEHGTPGVLRGDQALGRSGVVTEKAALRTVGVVRTLDSPEGHLIRRAGTAEQPMPAWMLRRPDESLSGYRDRLCEQFRIPAILAALTQIKGAYVEILNPLLSRRVVATAREMPDRLRIDKTLLAGLINSLGPKIPFASAEATPTPESWLAQPDFARHVVEEISAREARDVFEGVFLDGLTAGLAPAGGRDRTPQRSPRQRHKSALPGRVSAVARSVAGSPPLSIRRLALRAYIAVRMARLLDDDAHLSRP